MTKKIIPKGVALRTTIDVREGKPIVRINGDDVVVAQGTPPKKRYKKKRQESFTQEFIDQLPDCRKAAKEMNTEFYFTGVPCKNGHTSVRQTINGICIECAQMYGTRTRDRKIAAGEDLNKVKTNIRDLLSKAKRKIQNKDETEVTDRVEAARQGLLYFYDPEPCLNGHINKQRSTRTGLCLVCVRIRSAEALERRYKRDVVVDNENLMKNPTISVEDK